MASRTLASRTLGNTGLSLRGRPLVGVAGMLVEAAQVTFGINRFSLWWYASPMATGSPEAKRLLPADCRVQVGQLEVGLH